MPPGKCLKVLDFFPITVIKSWKKTQVPKSPWNYISWSSKVLVYWYVLMHTVKAFGTAVLLYNVLLSVCLYMVGNYLFDETMLIFELVFTTRAYARAVLGVVILSVCLSVSLSHACIVTKLNDTLQIFLYHTKGQSLCYSDTKSGWSATPPSLWNLRSKWPSPLRKAPTSTDFHS